MKRNPVGFGIGGALLGAAAFFLYVIRTPGLNNDGLTVMFFPPIMAVCGVIGVAVGAVIRLFSRRS